MYPGVCGASQFVAMTSTSPLLLGEVCLNEPIHSHNQLVPGTPCVAKRLSASKAFASVWFMKGRKMRKAA